MNKLRKMLYAIKKDKKKFAVLTASAVLSLAIPVLLLLICLELLTPAPIAPTPAPPPVAVVRIVAPDAYRSIAEERLGAALQQKLGEAASITLSSPDEAAQDAALTLVFGDDRANGLDGYCTLGIDGYSVSLADGTTAVARFLSAAGALAAADALADAVTLQDGTPVLPAELELLAPAHSEGSEHHRLIVCKDESFSALSVSSPNVDAHSLDALAALIDAAEADIVLFNGDLDCGARSRAELAAAWESIAELLEDKSVEFLFTLSDNEALPASLMCEVISSMSPCIGGGSGVYTVCREGGEPISSIILSSHDRDGCAELLVGAIDELLPFWKSPSGKKFPVLAVFPDTPSALLRTATALSACGAPAEDATQATATLLSAALAAGADHIVCGGAKNSYGVAEKLIDPLPESYPAALSPRMALCGSIGFSEEGLGGRFDLHNSLRGGISFAAMPDSCAFGYLYALKHTAEQ